jgi:hypothetical protein
MSVASLTTLAIQRDNLRRGVSVPSDGKTTPWSTTLASVIPTEILAGYTAVLGATVGSVQDGMPHEYLPFRFVWYIVGILATPAIVWYFYERRHFTQRTAESSAPSFPLSEVIAATIAATAWFTAMPGSPWEVVLGKGAFAILSTTTTVIGALLVGIFAHQLTKEPIPVAAVAGT